MQLLRPLLLMWCLALLYCLLSSILDSIPKPHASVKSTAWWLPRVEYPEWHYSKKKWRLITLCNNCVPSRCVPPLPALLPSASEFYAMEFCGREEIEDSSPMQLYTDTVQSMRLHEHCYLKISDLRHMGHMCTLSGVSMGTHILKNHLLHRMSSLLLLHNHMLGHMHSY